MYQHLLAKVKPERDTNRRVSYRDNWWIFGEPRGDLRPALLGLSRYIATPVTAKHRLFVLVDQAILPDDALIAVALDDGFSLGVLSSRIHSVWSVHAGGTLEDRERYNKSKVFDPFPFPDATPEQRAKIAELAEELDATRKQALAEVPGLTMTELYNLRELHRAGTATPQQQDRIRDARAAIVDRLHEQIDAAVAEAYGWEWPLAPAEIVARLVVLNAERAKEERQGNIRWLRPDYQRPRFGAGK